mmetsp:Transcript_105975/g.182763  ORF Transcript_105975/g.182763 Transcript_105975/m.182763 type:complete len:107 (-) Transcript_105975:656-976(-)
MNTSNSPYHRHQNQEIQVDDGDEDCGQFGYGNVPFNQMDSNAIQNLANLATLKHLGKAVNRCQSHGRFKCQDLKMNKPPYLGNTQYSWCSGTKIQTSFLRDIMDTI